MPNLLQIFILVLFFLNFSGVAIAPLPKASASAAHNLSHIKNEDEEFIPWSSYRRLNWNDFRSVPKRNTDAVASTSTSLGIAYQVKNSLLTYQVTCNFSKTKSWGLVKTAYILAHEQGHFDITEIYARKLHQALQSYNFNKRNYKQDVNQAYKKIVTEKEAFQEIYDKQTDHSRNKKEQAAWLMIIEKLLEDTTPYADYP
jgi:hypothetical protein